MHALSAAVCSAIVIASFDMQRSSKFLNARSSFVLKSSGRESVMSVSVTG